MTETTKTQYFVNKLTTGLGLRNGLLALPVGGFLEVTEDHLKEFSFSYALQHGWAELTHKKPAEPTKPEIVFSKPSEDGSISEAELLADKTPAAEVKEEKAVVVKKTTAVGKSVSVAAADPVETK